MIISFIVLCLLVMQASLAPQEDPSALLKADQLYYSVILGQYNSAASISTELQNNGKGHVIRLIVNKLLAESQRNVIQYAYQLVTNGQDTIVSDYFPIQIRWILMGEEVMFINRRDGMALKLEWHTDIDGDRGAFGDKNEWDNKRMAWKIVPVWYNNQKIYFEIVNMDFNQYLKLGVSSDGDGDHKAFGSHEHDTWRHLWYFHPVLVGGETLFYIFNRKYDQPLKLGRYVDFDGDRRAWGHNGYVLNNPEHYAWHIRSRSNV